MKIYKKDRIEYLSWLNLNPRSNNFNMQKKPASEQKSGLTILVYAGDAS
jgi:hypothetical protein